MPGRLRDAGIALAGAIFGAAGGYLLGAHPGDQLEEDGVASVAAPAPTRRAAPRPSVDLEGHHRPVDGAERAPEHDAEPWEPPDPAELGLPPEVWGEYERVMDEWTRQSARRGKHTTWGDADRLQLPEVLEENLDRVLSEVGGEILAMDCEAYPCIFAIDVPADYAVPVGAVEGTVGMHVLRALLDDAGYVDFSVGWAKVTTAQDGYRSVVALYSSEDDIRSLDLQDRGMAVVRRLAEQEAR